MDSDSSLDEEHNRGWNQGKQEPIPVRPNVEDNSDVSDEENISRAARSIGSIFGPLVAAKSLYDLDFPNTVGLSVFFNPSRLLFCIGLNWSMTDNLVEKNL